MEIKLEIKEYFDALKSIEDKFGQEEALYPWLFVIMKMAEEKKRTRLEEKYKDIDIISLPGARSGKALTGNASEIRKKLTEYVGVPDIAFISENNVLGCVEAKIMSKPFNLFKQEISSPKEFDFPKELEEKNINEGMKYVKGLKVGQDKPVCWRWRYNVIEFAELEDESEYGKHQLLCHLQKFNKVIYTNGLVFYYLRLNNYNDAKNKVSIIPLCDLSKEYIGYKGNIDNKLKQKWEMLIEKISNICWYDFENAPKLEKPYFIIKNREGAVLNSESY